MTQGTEQAAKQTIAIIGLGNVGLALANCLAKKHRVIVAGRNIDRVKETANHLSVTVETMSMSDAVKHADLSLLTVTDNAIGSVCELLTTHFKPNSTVAHCSGALDSELLASVKNIPSTGISTCSLHPLNTFPNKKAALEAFQLNHKTYLYCEGDAKALELTRNIFEDVGFIPVNIKPEAKTLYHASCTIACNYLTALMETSLQTAESAGIDRDQFWLSLQPLIQATIKNITESGTANALSGPIARGDIETVERHIAELEAVGGNTLLYKEMGKVAIELAMQSEDIDSLKLDKLNKLHIKV